MLFIFGGLAILWPQGLILAFNHLDLGLLIPTIYYTQYFAHLLGHGLWNEAICASCTYWKLTVLIGHLDEFIIEGSKLIAEHSLEITSFVLIALGIGAAIVNLAGITSIVGEFWIYFYFLLGAKVSSFIIDLAYHPRDSIITLLAIDIGELVFLAIRTMLEPCLAAYYAYQQTTWDNAVYAFFTACITALVRIIKKIH